MKTAIHSFFNNVQIIILEIIFFIYRGTKCDLNKDIWYVLNDALAKKHLFCFAKYLYLQETNDNQLTKFVTSNAIFAERQVLNTSWNFYNATQRKMFI